jgi:hypothetical protein
MINPLDEKRLKHINHLMDNIHDQSSSVYESLVLIKQNKILINLYQP